MTYIYKIICTAAYLLALTLTAVCIVRGNDALLMIANALRTGVMP